MLTVVVAATGAVLAVIEGAVQRTYWQSQLSLLI